MNKIDYYVFFLFFIKVLFIILAIVDTLFKRTHHVQAEITIKFWKDRLEFIFIAGVALLSIYLFNPRGQPKIIDKYQQYLLFVFAILVFIHSKWSLFFSQSLFISNLQRLTGGYH